MLASCLNQVAYSRSNAQLLLLALHNTAHTFMYDCCSNVIHPVKSNVHREHEAHQHLIGEHYQRLNNMEGVASKG